VPVRPPLQVSEGVVEVGWDAAPTPAATDTPDGDFDPNTQPPSPRTAMVPSQGGPAAAAPGLGEEFIEDRYAAIQAWNEWSETQIGEAGERPEQDTEDPLAGLDRSDATASSDDPADGDPGYLDPAYPGVRAEGQHGFAPYSQLFSRLRLPRDVP
jgi:hypothetical protein